ncbi:helix-turn-helix domain-containing protein [Priestia filamentosa]|uniref:helix-turn-helix domain-containing protein n=1 Tax=Priestia filamentosa TaxID=1402861 RepID=UPI00398285B5
MIRNDKELEISQKSLSEFISTTKNIDKEDSLKQLSPRKQEIYLKALHGEIENLSIQIEEYEELKKGNIKAVELQDATELPTVLIKYRIARGLSESSLADKLGMKESELIEHEENLFVDADPELIKKIVHILKVNIPSTLEEMLSENCKQITNKLKKVTGALMEKLLPCELKEEYNLVDGYLKLFTTLKRIFGEQSNGILSGSNIDYSPLVDARYKVPKGSKPQNIYMYTSYAYHIAKEISNIVSSQQKHLPTDPVQFRREIVERYGEFNLETCTNYIWDLGIPILPLKIKGGFHGACWRFNGRNVIVLKQQSTSSARWLFDLLHEYWHTTQDAHLPERSVVDLVETLSTHNEDQEEIDANEFAKTVIFNGKSEELFDECYEQSHGRIKNMKNAVIKVASSHDIDVSSLANHVAFKLSKMDIQWWPTAQNLQVKGNPFITTASILEDRLDINEIDDSLNKEILQTALLVV